MKFQVLLCALAFSVTACAQTTSGTHAASQGEFAPTQVPPLPAKLEFAGEAVPLGNYDTRESLTREMLTTLYMHSRTMQTLLASERYFAIIEPILKKYGVPDDFKYLCMAESGLNPEARSGAGAAGLWQLMPAYAKSAGLLVGGEVDERYHVEKSTEAACRYLVDAKRRLGSWTLAAASFNGPPEAAPLVEIPVAQQHRIPEIQHQIQNHRKPGKRTKHLRILQKIQMRHLPLKRTIREK